MAQPITAIGVTVPSIDTDGDLVRAARSGDRSALSELFGRHHGIAVAVAGRALTCPSDIDDAVAEGFTRAIERLETLRDPECFRAFLSACVRNAATDRHRRSARLIGGHPFDERPQPGGSVETLIETADEATRLVEAVDRLPVRQRYALRRFYWDDAPVALIATELELSANATTQLLFRAKASLARASLNRVWGESDPPARPRSR